jgi:hypothetical protein
MFRLEELCDAMGIVTMSETEFAHHYQNEAFLVQIRGIEGTPACNSYSFGQKKTDKISSPTGDILAPAMPVYPLDAQGTSVTYSIGRATQNSICMPTNQGLSRKHATLSRSGNHWRLRALNTTNGTRLFYDRDPTTVSEDIPESHGRILEDLTTIELGSPVSPDWLLFLKDARSFHRFVHQAYKPLVQKRQPANSSRLRMYSSS